MAHFSVMVVGENIQQQIYKYDENNLKEKVFKKEMSYKEMEELFNKEKKEKITIENYAYDTFRWIYDNQTNYFGIFINPYAKFDNSKIGGRFSYNLNIKDYEKGTCIALKSQIDMDRMINEAKQKAIDFKNYFINVMSFTEEDILKTFGSEQDNIDRIICEYCCPSYVIDGIWYEQGSQ